MTLEKLLSILCAKGWKPRWLNIMWKIVIDYDIEFAFDIYDSLQKWHWNFREDCLLMLLAIQEEPIKFLIEILK